MIGFKKAPKPIVIKDNTIPSNLVVPILDQYRNGYSAYEANIHLKLKNQDKVEATYRDCDELIETFTRIVNGESKQQREPTIIYYDIPENRTEFETILDAVILRDYNEKVQADYVETPEQLLSKVEVVLNYAIQYSDPYGTGTGDWDSFIQAYTNENI